MTLARFGLFPGALASRFALACAGLAAAAVLLVSLASWWLINQQNAQAERQLAARERQYHAAVVASTLRALAVRMSEVAGSTILATGLVDSAGKETYLAPFLNGIRQVNGIPVQVLFTDYEGQEIASNAAAQFDRAQLDWLRREMAAGQASASVFAGPKGYELIAFEPLRYARTATPEGALLYKIALDDMRLEPGLHLAWGPQAEPAADALQIDAPAVFKPMRFRLSGRTATAAQGGRFGPQYFIILFIALGMFFFVFVAGAMVARLLTRDLRRLEAFSSKVMSAGPSGQSAPEGGSAEVASLAVSINRMLERLHQQHEALKLEGHKLAGLADALKQADRRKDEFLAMLAHELRNPLAPISTGAELLRTNPGSEERVRRTSEIITRQVRHMTRIVDDLLDVSRVTRGLVALERAPVDMSGVIAEAMDQIRPFSQARQHSVKLQLPAEPLPVAGDQARLVQVVSNVLHNACKYTPSGGHIVVLAQTEESEVVLQVSDNGSGIAPDFMPEIFGLFTQGSRMPDRSQGGLGLGLPLVKHLVELHGGSVSAASEGLGKGTTFTIRLPLDDTRPVPQEMAPGLQPAAATRRLMVVDDNVDAAQTLATLLEMEGHEVSVAHDGAAALEQAQEFCPEIFILDIGLPGMDGIELARRLRQAPASREALLVALTGYGQEADRARSADAGFDRHLVKPVDLDVLKGLLASPPAEVDQ